MGWGEEVTVVAWEVWGGFFFDYWYDSFLDLEFDSSPFRFDIDELLPIFRWHSSNPDRYRNFSGVGFLDIFQKFCIIMLNQRRTQLATHESLP